jgi:hypothetical protein
MHLEEETRKNVSWHEAHEQPLRPKQCEDSTMELGIPSEAWGLAAASRRPVGDKQMSEWSHGMSQQSTQPPPPHLSALLLLAMLPATSSIVHLRRTALAPPRPQVGVHIMREEEV